MGSGAVLMHSTCILEGYMLMLWKGAGGEARDITSESVTHRIKKIVMVSGERKPKYMPWRNIMYAISSLLQSWLSYTLASRPHASKSSSSL